MDQYSAALFVSLNYSFVNVLPIYIVLYQHNKVFKTLENQQFLQQTAVNATAEQNTITCNLEVATSSHASKEIESEKSFESARIPKKESTVSEQTSKLLSFSSSGPTEGSSQRLFYGHHLLQTVQGC